MYSGSRQCQNFELKDDLKNAPFYNNECNDEDNTTKVVESRRGKCLDYNFNLCDDCEMWADSPCYRGEYCAMMNNDDVRKRLDDIVKNLMKSIIPKQINGRDLYGGYAVDMYAEYYANVQFGIGFTPISEDSDITNYFGFAQGMPLCGEDIDDICNNFEKDIRDEIVKRLALLCESVNKDTQ